MGVEWLDHGSSAEPGKRGRSWKPLPPNKSKYQNPRTDPFTLFSVRGCEPVIGEISETGLAEKHSPVIDGMAGAGEKTVVRC